MKIPQMEISVMGMKVMVDEYKFCERCKKGKCRFNGLGYPKYCPKCMSSKWYEDEVKRKAKEDEKYTGMADALTADKPAAIWEGRGRQIVTNKKGNIIANVPYKPRPTGRRDWVKHGNY